MTVVPARSPSHTRAGHIANAAAVPLCLITSTRIRSNIVLSFWRRRSKIKKQVDGFVAFCTRATVIKDHGAVRYNMDFVYKVETEEGKIK
jgi:hypothetical protein